MFRAKGETDKLLKKYGRPLVLKRNGEETPFKGFLQPLRYKNKMYLSSVSTELCYDSTGKYLLICPADVYIADADGYSAVISDETKLYTVDRCELVYFGQNPLYCWSVVTSL